MRPNLIISFALLVLAATLILLVNTAGAQTDPPASGDWTVGDNTTIGNQTVRLQGNLTIVPGGRLTLQNVTLQIFSSINDTHGIRVMDNGTLEISDLDGNAGTKDDRSVVMRGIPSQGYTFLAEKGSKLYLDNSLIIGAGARVGTSGVLVRTSGLRLNGMTFMDGRSYGLMLEGSKYSVVNNCDFQQNKDGLVLKRCDNITVNGSSLEQNDRVGLRIENSNKIVVTGCKISFNDQTGIIIVGGKENEVEDTKVYENPRGMVLISASWFSLIESQVNDATFEGISISDGCHNITVYDTQVFDCGRSGLEVDRVYNLSVHSLGIWDCRYNGMRIVNGSRWLNLSMASYGNGYDGLHIENARDVLIQPGTFRNNGYNGVFLIDVRNITVRDLYLLNNTYDGLNCDNVVNLSMYRTYAILNRYNGINLQAGSHSIHIYSVDVRSNSRSGLYIDSAYNVTLRSVTSLLNDGYGIRIEGGAFNISGRLYSANNTGGALRVQDCHNVRFNASWLDQGNPRAYVIYGRDVSDIWISNSITNGTVHLIADAHVYMVHCTFDDIIPDVDGSSRLEYGEFVTVEVEWPNGEPVAGAAVNATGRGGEVLDRSTTRAGGTTEEMIVLFKAFVGESVSDQNPIAFWAKKGIEVARNTTTITERSRVFIMLHDDIPPVAVAPPVYAELGERATMNGSGSTDNGEVVSWVWTFGDGVGTVVLEGHRANWTFTVLGEFMGELNVSDSVGHWNTTTFSIQVTDTTAPVAEAGENVTVDQGEWVHMDGTPSTDNDKTLIATGMFWWVVFSDDPDVPPRMFMGPIVSIQFPDMGLFEVVLNVTDQSGNLGQGGMWVTVLDTTPPQVDAGPDVQVDEGADVRIEPLSVTDNDPAFDANLTAWWRVTGPDTDMTMDGLVLVFIAPRMGVYQATLHVSDAAGNEGTNSLLVTARDVIPPTVDIGMDMTVKMLSLLTFNASATTDNDPAFPDGAMYRWRISGPEMDEEHRGDAISFAVPWVGEYIIQLTVTDGAGNEGTAVVTVTSVDTALPEFGDISPTHLETVETGDVTVTFIITDVGTGIDPQTVEMRTRAPSSEPWTEWQRVSVASGGNRVEETMVLQFPQGTSALQLRCSDLAGNGPVVSEAFTIRVNSRPSVVMLSPTEGTDFGHLDEIKLDASPSSDADGDELYFRWSSDVAGLLGTEAVVTAPPLSPGTHRISVIVSDGVEGHDVLVVVTIRVLPEPSTVDPEEGVPWWVVLVAVLLFLGLALVVWDHLRGRRRSPPADEAEDRVVSP